jgi:hypothetical protein
MSEAGEPNAQWLSTPKLAILLQTAVHHRHAKSGFSIIPAGASPYVLTLLCGQIDPRVCRCLVDLYSLMPQMGMTA